MIETIYDAKVVADRWLGCNKHIKDISYCARHPECTGCEYEWSEKELAQALKIFTAENVLDVTLCKNCAYWEVEPIDGFPDGTYGYCKHNEGLMYCDGYCSAGE